LASTGEHVGANVGVTQTQSSAQKPVPEQKPTEHSVARPSQSPSLKHGIPVGTTIVVVVMLLDVLADVVDDVVDARLSRRCVVDVVVPGPPGTRVVVAPPLVVVVVLLVVVTPMHEVVRALARQRRTSVAAAAPGAIATRSRRMLPAGTVSVSASHDAGPHTGTSNAQTPSHGVPTSHATSEPARPPPCALAPSRHERRTVRAEASPASATAARTAHTSTRCETPTIGSCVWC
jgi:hypothetical protein